MSWFSDTFLGTESSAGKRSDYLTDRKQGDYEKYAQGWGEQADKFQQMGDEFFDPMSGRNQQQYGMMQDAIGEQTTAGIRDWQGAMAQQGMGNAGGIGAQNILQQRRRAGGDSAKAMGQAYQQSFGRGMQAHQMSTSERSKGATATGAADQIYAGANQAKMAQDTSNAQKKAGFAQMVGGAAMSYMMPGVGSMLTGALSKYGGKAGQALAQPHIMNQNMQYHGNQAYLNQIMNPESEAYKMQGARPVSQFGWGGGQDAGGGSWLTQGLMKYGLHNSSPGQTPTNQINVGGQTQPNFGIHTPRLLQGNENYF